MDNIKQEQRTKKYKLEEIDLDQIKALTEAGWTNQQIADFYGIHITTYLNYQKSHPELKALIREWKTHADEQVERSLYERAIGYSHPDEKIFFEEEDVVEGEVVLKKKKIIRVAVTKHYPPDPVSMIFWLTNRRFGDWKRTRQETGSDPLSVKVFNLIKQNGHSNGKKSKKKSLDVNSTVKIERLNRGGGLQVVD